MKIQTLLETDLYRYQQEWITDDRPSFVVFPRVGGRLTNSSATITYSIHYGLAKIGVEIPRRWNSSFTTTSPANSPFISNIKSTGGIRQIIVPSDRPCGFAERDFNYLNITSKVQEVNAKHVALFRELAKTGKTNGKAEQFEECNNEFWNLTNAMRTSNVDYQKFSSLMAKIDALLAEQNLPSLTDQLVIVIEPAVTNNLIGQTTIGALPEGNYEVWFEGPYEAHLIDDADTDGPDPHDFDR